MAIATGLAIASVGNTEAKGGKTASLFNKIMLWSVVAAILYGVYYWYRHR